MRPLRLMIENFASFKGHQPPLDLSGYDLFAIAGPTGAGKSSLLDAIVFALYGRTPRLSKGLGEIISLGRERAAVTLEFRSGARELRVTRVVQRGRTGSAQLEEMRAGRAGRPLCDGVQKVNAEIERLLGLSYDAFTQAVILPQGQFADFLKSAPKERRQILSDLLRLGIYERMRRRASDEAGRLKNEVSFLEGRAHGFADATPAAVEETRATLARLDEVRGVRALDLDARQTRVEVLRTRAAAFRERAERRAQAQRLDAQAEAVAAARARLAAAQRAADVLPRLERVTAAESRAAESARRHDEAAGRAQRLRTARESAARALARAAEQAAELPALDETLRALDQAAALVLPRDDARRRAAQARGDLARVRAERADARQRATTAAADAEARAAEHARASDALAGVGYDAGRHDRVQQHRGDAARLEGARLAADAAATERLSAARRAADGATRRARCAADAQAAAQRLLAATDGRVAAEAALRAAERRDAALHLRAELRAGEACPVCAQPVAQVPADEHAAPLDEPRRALDAARQAEESARRADSSARETLARADADAAQAREADQVAARQADDSAQARDALVRALAHDLAAILPDVAPDEPRPEARLLAALEALTGQRRRHEQALARRDQAQRDLDAARRAADEARAHETRLAQREADLEQRAADDEAAAAEHEMRLRALTDAEDPRAARETVAARAQALRQAHEQAQEAERRTAVDQAGADSELREAERTLDEAQRALRASQREARQAALEAGFGDEAAALEAQLAPPEQQRLRAEVEHHDRERHAVEQRLLALDAELRDLEFDDAAFEREEQALHEARQAHDQAVREEAALRQRLEDLERRAEQGASLALQLSAAQARHEVQRQLAHHLRNENFQAYLLEEAFRELVAGASSRLLDLSGRYTFEFHDDAFHVLDHDNARERRSVDTLSGGETFLASLALALEMSQQVQRAAGAVHLDSLFIDEGFGTLDGETLETIAAAVEGLNVGGRMVGIITHIAELTRRFDVRLEVEKRPEGSRVSLRAD